MPAMPLQNNNISTLEMEKGFYSNYVISTPKRVTLPQKTGGELLFLLCACWGFFSPEELLQVKHQCGETQQPVPQCSCAWTFLCAEKCLEESWGKHLQRALHNALPAVSQDWDVFPNLTWMELCLTMRKPNCLYFSVISIKNMLEKIRSRRTCHLYQQKYFINFS